MRLAILFWCYKRPEICADRLKLLRRFNPDTPIFCLFGGDVEQAAHYERRLAPLADDFYVFRDPPPLGSEQLLERFRGGRWWKYVYGDLMLAAWYRDRGRHLEWDSVVVAQWDMLIYGPIERTFAALGPGEILLSGLRPVAEVEHAWGWIGAGEAAAESMYAEFLDHLRQQHDYREEPLCCVAVVLALPREFLRRFSIIDRPELGFLEYRLPMYAQVFGIPFCTEHPFRPWWGAVERYSAASTLRARPREIWPLTILYNLLRPSGARVFHPYWGPAPVGVWGWVRALPRALLQPIASRLSAPWNR